MTGNNCKIGPAIGFIGTGGIASALVKGFCGTASAAHLWLLAPSFIKAPRIFIAIIS